MHASQKCSAPISDAFHTHSGHVLHAFWTRPHLAKKGHGTHVCLAAALLQSFALARTRLAHTLYVSHMRPACVSDVSERYLGAELYRIALKPDEARLGTVQLILNPVTPIDVWLQ